MLRGLFLWLILDKSEEKDVGGYAIDRREIPPLREPTRSLREREEKASARFGRNDTFLLCGSKVVSDRIVPPLCPSLSRL